MSSLFIMQSAGESTGKLEGKEAVGAYWRKVLTLIPGLREKPRSRLNLKGYASS